MQNNPNRLSFVKPEKSPVFYGYIIVVMGTLGVIISIPGQTIGVSAFNEPIQEALGLNSDRFSFAYMAGTLLSSLFLTRAGKLYDRFGARWVAFFSTLGLAVSLLLCASSKFVSETIQHIMHIEHWLISTIIIGLFLFLLRFSGQGVLTMASRNMIMKWFDTRRGRVNAVSSAIVAVTFSISPRWTFRLVDNYGWSKAWIYLAFILIILAFIVFQFFRDKPEDHGLLQDGGRRLNEKSNAAESLSAKRQFTLAEAKETRAFWMYSLMLSFNAFFVTGFTFQIESIFVTSGFSAERGITIFLPVSIISLTVTIIGNAIADWIKLIYLLYAMILGGIFSSLGLVFLSMGFGYYFLLFGNGLLGGIFAILVSITWPRFFGRKCLGEISGKAMSMIVMASAVAPFLFSLSLTYLKTYAGVGFLSLLFLVFVAITSVKAKNPQ